jgi:hypothetical protein
MKYSLGQKNVVEFEHALKCIHYVLEVTYEKNNPSLTPIIYHRLRVKTKARNAQYDP